MDINTFRFICLGERVNEDGMKPKEFVQRFLQNRKEYTTVVYKTRVGTHANQLVKIFAKNDK